MDQDFENKERENKTDDEESEGDSDSDAALELERQVYELCESAYASGLSPQDIYTALHSPLERCEYDCDPTKKNKTPGGVSHDSEHFLGRLRSLIFATILTVFLAVVGYFGICVAFEVNPLAVFPSLQEMRCLVPTHPVIQEMVRPIANCSVCIPLEGGSASPVIELEKVPSKAEFSKIAYLSKPIIVRRGAVASNVSVAVDFNFARLKGIFESEEGGVDTVTQECQFLPFRSPFSSLREAFDLISSESGTWDRPWYIGWSNCHPGVASKLRELFPRPSFLPEDSESSAIDWIFIGSPGLGAAMHVDYVKRPSWQAQLSGVKTWHLRPPPECEEACPAPVVFTLRPGDLLFLETNLWYHQTHIEGQQLSISIGSEYD